MSEVCGKREVRVWMKGGCGFACAARAVNGDGKACDRWMVGWLVSDVVVLGIVVVNGMDWTELGWLR